ncbi:exopolysaccharide Pel transporter PelG [Pandoraea nosoerga]|uniref:Histidine kinase n=1 Tax=Pandoraea nosoerga TaxID=2508296 RepID=A0A5E4XZI9_9BURK|nr:exopolysaccharide Pel transporter PelG [Pandoraea nosoerga]MBN4666478.1 exopolysaccharide Pel transporter PelG [Pandoraea nosoerga]MBN4677503.1 exopolysaccharide Pel transporter PelG [Pandoraea nosoerga]MBN4682323.1 exopolysaccharide Pel transporter PelG [Pandoraea nosoerga]MBN4745638.1 exopolysaccharide Pel transporter PelG [Pandoraea nosoerga]VVE41707.1 histidine kinase [Pandoraea nosoerga]
MAGIGFELRRLLRSDTLSGTLAAYSYAGIISAGPLVLSMVGVVLVGLMSLANVHPPQVLMQFQVSVTYLIASSVIATGLIQLAFTRYLSDRLFAGEPQAVMPSFNAVTLVTTVAMGVVGLVLSQTLFAGQPLAYRWLMWVGFVLLGNLWIVVLFLTSVKQYRAILGVFCAGYSLCVVSAVLLGRYGLAGLLGGFVIGHTCLLLGLTAIVVRQYRTTTWLSWDVFVPRNLRLSLVGVGVCFGLGVWIDKLIFWASPATGMAVIGPLRAAPVYDLPIFLSYLCVMPGMAVFLLRIETDFAEAYAGFFDAIRHGGTLRQISASRISMVRAVRAGLYEILKVQAVVTLLVFAFGDDLLRLVGMPAAWQPLLRVDVIAAGLQVLLLGVLNVLFYLDRRRDVLLLTGLLVVLNAVLTWATLHYGPALYGYGFAAALLGVLLLGAHRLARRLAALEYDTYMGQQGVRAHAP